MIPKRNEERNETDFKNIQLHLFRFVTFLRDGDSRYVPFRFKKMISVSFRFGKIAVFRFVLFLLDIVSFRFHSVSEKYGECSSSLRFVSNRSFSNQFRFARSVPFKCTGLSVSERFVPVPICTALFCFQTLSIGFCFLRFLFIILFELL